VVGAKCASVCREVVDPEPDPEPEPLPPARWCGTVTGGMFVPSAMSTGRLEVVLLGPEEVECPGEVEP
jgi:hypothetical protein